MEIISKLVVVLGGAMLQLSCLIRFRLPVSEIEIEDDSIKQSYEGGGSAYLMNLCLTFVSEKM